MFLSILIISLGILLIFNIFIFKKDLASPAISFILGFFLCALNLINFVYLWKVHIHAYTFFLIVGSCLSLSLGALFCDRTKKMVTKNGQAYFSPISVSRLKFLFSFQCAMSLIQIYYLNKFYGMGNLAANLAAHTMELKFGEDVMKLPSHIAFAKSIFERLGFIFAFLLPIYLGCDKKYQKNLIWLTFNFILSLVASLLSSGRTTLLALLITVGTSYILTLRFRHYRIKMKSIVLWSCIAYIFLSGFQQLGYLIGREESDNNNSYTVGMYCGAQIQNLDDFIFQHHEKATTHFGEVTFHKYYERLQEKYQLVNLQTDYSDFMIFNERRGYSLGNVSSALLDYNVDFGITGTFFICFFIGYIMQYFYRKTLNSNVLSTGMINIKVFIYILLVSTMFMSFFSEKFFTQIIGMINISFWISYIVIYWLLYGYFPWKKRY